jgi:hypothetical protein
MKICIQFVNVKIIFDYTNGTECWYKYTYSINHSNMLGTYNAFKNQTLTINISV